MKNIKEIIERYQDHLQSPHGTVTGFLQWGAKEYYLKNSSDSVLLNATSSGFILNDVGEVEIFSMEDPVVTRIYYTEEDAYFESPVPTPWFWDRKDARKWWGPTLDNFYPWPWFPEKEISYFEVIRIIPGHSLGDKLPNNDIKYYLDYPEFFKPIYK